MANLLVTADGACSEQVNAEVVGPLLKQDGFFWLDLQDPSEEEIRWLKEIFEFHPLAIEDAEHFGQRPKLDDYEDFLFLVIYGASGGEKTELSEVHCFLSGKALVTVHRDEIACFDEVRDRYAERHLKNGDGSLLLYRVVDALVDSLFPMLDPIDGKLETLEDAVFDNPETSHLRELAEIKRTLVSVRRVAGPQRDLFARLLGELDAFPELAKAEHHFRDVYDHLIRLSSMVDDYRDLVSGTRDLYNSTVANNQNEVMKRLTLVATIFMPLGFLTGYFGQNLGWLVNHLGGTTVFWGAGVAAPLLSVVVAVVLFKRQGWL